MKSYVENPLAEWRVEIQNRQDLVTDPDAQRRKLAGLAMLAHRRHQVTAEELSDMLEWTDAARLWGLLELEEADFLGLFDAGRFPDDGIQIIRGKG
jgi:hypothetical protein